jgi:hypothetical protein
VILTEEGKKYVGLYKQYGLVVDSVAPWVYYKLAQDSLQFAGYKTMSVKKFVCEDSNSHVVIEKVMPPLPKCI